MRKEINKISLSAIFSALIVVFMILGTIIEILDITTAALCSIIIFISQIEIKGKYPSLIYLTSSVLSLIFMPLSSATLYFIGFFGYYPIIRLLLSKYNKKLRKILCFVLFNISMVCMFLLFKALFALQNEPYSMYTLLLITINIFFLCFDYLFEYFAFIYFKKIRNKIKFLNR